jgi:hypothetical protein
MGTIANVQANVVQLLSRRTTVAIALGQIGRSNPIVSVCWEKFLLCFVATVLIFFIAGLLYLLRFERVDNLGAYSIPSETGLLIPSDFNS